MSDKICMNCFDKFKEISHFYNLCKNSQSQYTPCFRDSLSSVKGNAENKRVGTPRILSTVTPDITSSSSAAGNNAYPSISLSSHPSNSPSRSVPIQSCQKTESTQSNRQEVKKRFPLRHDLGIKLPKPILQDRGCFDSADLCYTVLKDEFECGETGIETDKKSSFPDWYKKTDFPPISPKKEERLTAHTHISHCPFCTTYIPRQHGPI